MASLIFATGIIATGLLSIPVLAGSAAFAVGETRKWPVGLSRKPRQAAAFYFTIAIAILIGIGLNFTAINPIKALYWSAVLNGFVAVPVMIILMVMSSRKRIMGRFTVGTWLGGLGWVATLAMTMCLFVTIATWVV
jgi:Mn2+/Fe2+ NRAMP family transporter